jgi:cell shape-determining protein MreC
MKKKCFVTVVNEDYKEYFIKHDELVKEIHKLKKENEALKEETERYEWKVGNVSSLAIKSRQNKAMNNIK